MPRKIKQSAVDLLEDEFAQRGLRRWGEWG
jgi:hypothetical protein